MSLNAHPYLHFSPANIQAVTSIDLIQGKQHSDFQSFIFFGIFERFTYPIKPWQIIQMKK